MKKFLLVVGVMGSLTLAFTACKKKEPPVNPEATEPVVQPTVLPAPPLSPTEAPSLPTTPPALPRPTGTAPPPVRTGPRPAAGPAGQPPFGIFQGLGQRGLGGRQSSSRPSGWPRPSDR